MRIWCGFGKGIGRIFHGGGKAATLAQGTSASTMVYGDGLGEPKTTSTSCKKANAALENPSSWPGMVPREDGMGHGWGGSTTESTASADAEKHLTKSVVV